MCELLHTLAQKIPVGERNGPCWASSLAAAAQAIAVRRAIDRLTGPWGSPEGPIRRIARWGTAGDCCAAGFRIGR